MSIVTGRVRYKIDVYSSGVSATTGSIAFTLQSSQLANGAPSVGGYLARPTLGRVESQPWSFSPLDLASTFAGRLFGGSGRLQLMGRLVRARRSIDSTATSNYKSLAVGRISDIAQGQDVSSYTVNVSDDRVLERNTQIFGRLNRFTSLIPAGIMETQAPAIVSNSPGLWQVKVVNGNLVALLLITGRVLLQQGVADFMRNDGKTGTINAIFPIANPYGITAGFFNHLRFRKTDSGTDYEIGFIGAAVTVHGATVTFSPPLHPGDGIPNIGTTDGILIWLVWTAAQPAVGALIGGYVHAAGAPPSAAVPLWVGGVNGFKPGNLVRQIYDGAYSTAAVKVRHSTAAFDAWEARADQGFVFFRITAPILMADFVEKRLYQPYGMLPMIDSSGKVSPVSILAPSSLSTANTVALNRGNLRAPHPTWQQVGREVVNALTVSVEQYNSAYYFLNLNGPVPSADVMIGNTRILSTAYTNTYGGTVASVGRRELALSYGAINSPGGPIAYNSTGPQPILPDPNSFIAFFQRGIFERFGDGPAYTDANCLASVDATTLGSIKPGGWVRLQVDSLPGLASTRYLQVMRRQETIQGPILTLLDFGPLGAALTAPNASISLSSYSSHFAIKFVMLSTTLTPGGRFDIRMAVGTSTGAPAAASSRWRVVYAGGTSSTGTIQRGGLASNRWWWSAMRATKPGRVSSPWTVRTPGLLTAKINGPTGIAASSISAGRAKLKWAYGSGSSIYPTEVLLTNSTAQTLGSSLSVGRTLPASTAFQLTNLTTGSKHKSGVRHCDPFGGFSTIDSVIFTASGAAVAPKPRGIIIVAGKP